MLIPSSQPTSNPSQPSSQPSSLPSSLPTTVPSSVPLQSIPIVDYVYIGLAASFSIATAWSVFCCTYHHQMAAHETAYQSVIYAITVGDQVTDCLFTIHVYYSLAQVQARKDHGDRVAASEYQTTLLFFILVLACKGLVFIVNFFCILLYGDLRYILIFDPNSYASYYVQNFTAVFTQPMWISINRWFSGHDNDNGFQGICAQPRTEIVFLAFPLLFSSQVIIFFCLVVSEVIGLVLLYLSMVTYLIMSNVLLFFTALSNSELNFMFFGREDNKYPMTLIGLLSDDVPQLILQVTYAVIVATQYHHALDSIQIASFAFTIWRLMYVVYRKYVEEVKRTLPPRFNEVPVEEVYAGENANAVEVVEIAVEVRAELYV